MPYDIVLNIKVQQILNFLLEIFDMKPLPQVFEQKLISFFFIFSKYLPNLQVNLIFECMFVLL